MATVIDVLIDKGSDIIYEFEALDEDNKPFNLTGCDIILTARRSLTDISGIIVMSLNSGIVINDAANGTWQVDFNALATRNITHQALVYDQYIHAPDGEYRATQGMIYLNPSVT